jgi:hypothetical protein
MDQLPRTENRKKIVARALSCLNIVISVDLEVGVIGEVED